MKPQALQPLLALEQRLLDVIAQLEPNDPDCARLLVAHAHLVAALDDAATRTGCVLAQAQAIIDAAPPITDN